MQRFGSRPALVNMSAVSDYFGEKAPYRIEGGVAMIDISGALSNDPWSWGGTTYGEIQDQVKIAAADPEVKGILLCVNSPGGETDNAFETAAVIARAGEQKPVYAVAGTMAYSAAYLLACQAEKIFVFATTGGVGSIGVWCAHGDYSEMLAKAGVKFTLISAGEGKVDGNPYQPLSEKAQLKIQTDVDRLYGEFVGAVATGRDMSPIAVVKLGAFCYEGSKAALSSGLADVAGDVTDAWAALSQQIEDDNQDDEENKYPLMRGSQRVASATNSTKDKTQMAETKIADAAQVATPVPVPTAAEIQTLVTEARSGGFEEAGLIADMCAIANSPKATDFIRQKKTLSQVTSELLADKVAADAKTEIDTASSVKAAKSSKDGEPTEHGTPKPWSEITAQLTGKGARK